MGDTNQMRKILFNDVRQADNYTKNIALLFSDYELFRKKHFSNLCIEHLQKHFSHSDLLLTHSATSALEMIAMLLDIKQDDEIILPSFTFVSTANAFVSKGAKPVFIDINFATLNIDETLIEQAITPRTKAIIAMHYAGHACNMKALKEICEKYNLALIEDAAMAYGSFYEDQPLGSIGDFGVISFDITKHISAVQGGLLLINNKSYSSRASNIYHIGTNREDFAKGIVQNYEWVDVGAKFQMNELNAAILYHGLTEKEQTFSRRKHLSDLYYHELQALQNNDTFRLMNENLIENNIHEFYLILTDKNSRDKLSGYLRSQQIEAHSHYTALHLSPMGKKAGQYFGTNNTEQVASRLLRLPLHNQLNDEDVKQVAKHIKSFFNR